MKKILSLGFLLGLGGYAFLHQKKFGARPNGRRLKKIKQSVHFHNGQFHNLSPTPSFTEGANYLTVMKKFLLEKNSNSAPPAPIPSSKTDLTDLHPKEDALVWFGHSSYFIQSGGIKILVDPVFSGTASPVSFTNKAFPGTDRYTAADIPEIDYLFLTHDHWDHCDHDTLTRLKPKIKKIITGLGTGAHLELWGFEPKIITEMDWDETFYPGPGFTVHAVPARHFSGRGFKRNGVLWISFVLQTPQIRIFIGGDSGYDSHFMRAGEKFGPFDLAILECGQYNRHWKYIHMMPGETYQAAVDLKAKKLLAVHNSKFALATHDWDDPLNKICAAAKEGEVELVTPMIGEKVDLLEASHHFSRWWEEVGV